MKEKTSHLLTNVYSHVVVIRDTIVIADADVAFLYNVETKRINEAVRNNQDKFPKSYMFELSPEEVQELRSKNSTTKVSSKSKSALEVTFAIIETFTAVRNLKKQLMDLHQEKNQEKQAIGMQHFGKVLSDIVMPDLQTSETESTLELNFVIGKIKHTVKRIKKKGCDND